jgi:NADH-quinone oxidoreductase subunit E
MARSKSHTQTKALAGEAIQFSESVLSRISDELGIPISEVSHVVETLGQVAKATGDVDKIVDEYKGDKSALIQILLAIQRENRWLPRDVLISVCEKLGVPLSHAYRIATFYKAFSLSPQGRHKLSVCMGTACHVRGSPRLLDRVVEAINIKPGETSADQRFSLETVNCLGCCALGPVVVVDGEYHSNPAKKELEAIVGACD